MKFGIDNCAMQELERGRLVRSEGIEFPWRKVERGRSGRVQIPWGTSAG